MNCDEAQELMESVWDLPDDDLRRQRLKAHVQTCSSCAVEYEMWVDSLEMVQALDHEVPEMDEEQMNRNVMDRIYRDFPWLVEETSKSRSVSRMFRKRLTLWIAGFLALFVCSFVYFAAMGGQPAPEVEETITGIIPTGVAGSGQTPISQDDYKIPRTNSGIIDPFVVDMSPTEPEYWMILSLLSVGLAMFFLMRLNRVRR
ncbi:hypothetical protein JCM10914A_39610 [Paenibacillus sp. JCM 10914]|uniref:anti-sigma factor family protein n=1 Tax=Paenibacillus sp. JCM 10914 TaxID=1236974 RepID=UPI0003CC337D|nr:zf-HC2 domain-containing protein [Paenibacillus sp. JCM 10914]GAE04684.1 hypothetical protein JCM10914_739 [Paenibacillus sp. JCM 10914]